ncbi:MAG TPA: outer membrane beta-barrel domain-containing protein [Burkholderiaceae bacterium]|nr:outer membrane beta-barrel domain-containing protein [Burkholderiaceae bacterium]
MATNNHQVLAAVLLALAVPAFAQSTQTPRPANEQVVVPQVDRRDVKLPKFPSKDFEVGAFAGVYSTENFGASAVGGLRVGYHITEDFFVQANVAATKVSDETLRRILAGNVFRSPKETLSYYNLSVGVNVLPGEVFLGRQRAKATAVYLIGGIGSTRLDTQRRQTFNFGLGMRMLLAERAAIQVDLRDHVFSFDLLGKRESTQNLELTTGFSWYF